MRRTIFFAMALFLYFTTMAKAEPSKLTVSHPHKTIRIYQYEPFEISGGVPPYKISTNTDRECSLSNNSFRCFRLGDNIPALTVSDSVGNSAVITVNIVSDVSWSFKCDNSFETKDAYLISIIWLKSGSKCSYKINTSLIGKSQLVFVDKKGMKYEVSMDQNKFLFPDLNGPFEAFLKDDIGTYSTWFSDIRWAIPSKATVGNLFTHERVDYGNLFWIFHDDNIFIQVDSYYGSILFTYRKPNNSPKEFGFSFHKWQQRFEPIKIDSVFRFDGSTYVLAQTKSKYQTERYFLFSIKDDGSLNQSFGHNGYQSLASNKSPYQVRFSPELIIKKNVLKAILIPTDIIETQENAHAPFSKVTEFSLNETKKTIDSKVIFDHKIFRKVNHNCNKDKPLLPQLYQQGLDLSTNCSNAKDACMIFSLINKSGYARYTYYLYYNFGDKMMSVNKCDDL